MSKSFDPYKDTVLSACIHLTPPEYLVFADLQLLNISPSCSDVEVHSWACQYTVTSVFGVVRGATGLNISIRGGAAPFSLVLL